MSPHAGTLTRGRIYDTSVPILTALCRCPFGCWINIVIQDSAMYLNDLFYLSTPLSVVIGPTGLLIHHWCDDRLLIHHWCNDAFTFTCIWFCLAQTDLSTMLRSLSVFWHTVAIYEHCLLVEIIGWKQDEKRVLLGRWWRKLVRKNQALYSSVARGELMPGPMWQLTHAQNVCLIYFC